MSLSKNRKRIPSEDCFSPNQQSFATEIKFCSLKWVVKLPWVGKWATV